LIRGLLLAALLAGCAHAVPRPRPPGAPAPTPDQLMTLLLERQQALTTLELETRTTSWVGGDRVRATVLMLIDRTGRLRFDAEVPVQGLAASLAVHDGVFAQLDLQHRLFREGPACPTNVAQLIPIPMLPEEVAAILLGDAPLGPTARAVEVGWDGARQADVLAIERPAVDRRHTGAAARLWVTLSRAGDQVQVLAVEGEAARTPGKRWRVSYDELSKSGPVPMPGVVRFAEPGRSFDDGVEVKVKERLGVNRGLRDESFVLSAPAGFQIEHMSCPP
jgi:hypothetical protein